MKPNSIKKYKVLTIVGTRPEVIRLSRIIPLFDKHFSHRLVHTGQNYDPNLNQVFFHELGIREPDKRFEIQVGSFAATLSQIFQQIEIELSANRPDAVVILGDTNSSLCAIVAKKHNIPIYHLEAGNRSFDQNVPEEINRKIVDHVADFNFVYSEFARRNLLNEGLHPNFICLIGSPLREVINYYRSDIQSSEILEKLNLEPKQFFLASVHRQENVNTEARLKKLVETIFSIQESFNKRILVSLHPRTKSLLEKYKLSFSKNVIVAEPFGFFDYCKLQSESLLSISDSGSISEEAAILGTKSLTLRNSMERQEALESGVVPLAGLDRPELISIIEAALALDLASSPPIEYSIEDSSLRVLKFMLSTIGEYKFWKNLR